jgi:hypothetical protein
MRSVFITLILLVLLSLVLAACGGAGAPTPTPASPGAQISLTTNPDPPQSGNVELIVMVNDANGQPIPDAEVYVFADHTDMKGMNMNGKATAQGNGRYAITADFSMSGQWKVTVQVRGVPPLGGKTPLNVAQDFNLEFK